jgi:hypothetical protein
LETQATLAHRGDPFAQFRGAGGEARSAAWPAPGLRLALPPFDLTQHADHASTSRRPTIEAHIERHEVGAGGR